MTLRFPVQPMKATLGSLPASDDGWAYEIKWDGHRTLAHVEGGGTRLQSGGGHDVSERWSEATGLGGSINADSAILDGEIVVLGDDGLPRFDLVQRRHGRGGTVRTAPADATDVTTGHLMFQIFDVLSVNGTDTVDLPYLDRRRLLGQLVEPGPHWGVPEHRVGDGAELVAATAERGMEGVIAKRLDSRYRVGGRSKEWRKIKHRRSVELPIGGFTAGEGARASTFGALLLGHPGSGHPRSHPAATDETATDESATDETRGEDTVTGLRFAGGVGTGFDATTLVELRTRLEELRTGTCPFEPPPPRPIARTATWVVPELVARVEIAEFTND
ncbi:MAG: hypothetical protein AAGG08_04270, partial [Actinomycetota bacterium]